MDARGYFRKLTNAFPSQAKSFHCDFLELPQETMVPGSHHSHLIVYNNPNTFWCQDYCPHCTETEKYTASQVEDPLSPPNLDLDRPRSLGLVWFIVLMVHISFVLAPIVNDGSKSIVTRSTTLQGHSPSSC